MFYTQTHKHTHTHIYIYIYIRIYIYTLTINRNSQEPTDYGGMIKSYDWSKTSQSTTWSADIYRIDTTMKETHILIRTLNSLPQIQIHNSYLTTNLNQDQILPDCNLNPHISHMHTHTHTHTQSKEMNMPKPSSINGRG